MPKPSLLKKDNAAGAGFGFGEGWGRIVDLKAVAHQFQASKKTGEQQAPACFLFVSIDRTDENGKSVGEDPTTDELKIGELQYFRPGGLKKPDDPDSEPEDLGDDLGTEGNSIYSTGEKKFGQSAKGKVFLDSIEDAGFSKDVIARCYLPDYVGLLAHFTQTTVTPTGGTRKIDPYQVLTVDRILEFPYDGAGKKGPQAVASGKAASKVAPAAKSGAPAKITDSGPADGDAEEIAKAFLASMLEKWAGTKQPVAKLAIRSLTYCGSLKPPAQPKVQSAVQRIVGDGAWLAENASTFGITVDQKKGEVTFPSEDD